MNHAAKVGKRPRDFHIHKVRFAHVSDYFPRRVEIFVFVEKMFLNRGIKENCGIIYNESRVD